LKEKIFMTKTSVMLEEEGASKKTGVVFAMILDDSCDPYRTSKISYVAGSGPRDYDNVWLISRGTGFDTMAAWNDGDNSKNVRIFIGHWNDGIVE
jgi:hypothetical protein